MEEIIKCKYCGNELSADHDDLGSYFCKCQKKQIDKDLLARFVALFPHLDSVDTELD
jgi:hypothetical protein